MARERLEAARVSRLRSFWADAKTANAAWQAGFGERDVLDVVGGLAGASGVMVRGRYGPAYVPLEPGRTPDVWCGRNREMTSDR